MTSTVPDTPQPPQLGDAQFDAKMRLYEAWQRSESTKATQRLAAANEAAGEAARTLSQDPRLGYSQRRAEVLQLVSTMTSAQRAKPDNAVRVALDTLAAIDRALGL